MTRVAAPARRHELHRFERFDRVELSAALRPLPGQVPSTEGTASAISRVCLLREAAATFRSLAPHIKFTVLPFARGPVFSKHIREGGFNGCPGI